MNRAAWILSVALLASPVGVAFAQETAVVKVDIAAQLRARLQTLDADSRYNNLAMFERSRAAQALAAFENARNKDKPEKLFLAETRVTIAETAAKTQLLDGEIIGMDREIADLNLELTRRENQRIAAENERLKIEAANREEEARKLREQAAAAQTALDQIEAAEQSKLNQARAADLKLAKEEAELVAGSKLPPALMDQRGEVFTLSGDAFAAANSATLSSKGLAQIKVLAEYIKITTGGTIAVQGHTDNAGNEAAQLTLSKSRAESVAAALKKAGTPAARLQPAQGLGARVGLVNNDTAANRWKNKRVEVVIAPPAAP